MAKVGEASVVLRNPDIASVKGRQICLKISAIFISDLREALTLKMIIIWVILGIIKRGVVRSNHSFYRSRKPF